MTYQVKEYDAITGKRIELTNELNSRARAESLRDYYRERKAGKVYVKRIKS
jgi:hypothetical protein